MQRILMDKLIKWKNAPSRKPLLLHGIRRCGKTYLLKEFGARHFKNVLYCDFEERKGLRDLFTQDLEPHRLIKDLSIYYETDITPGETLIIFDEVCFCKYALDALKYFCDDAPEFYIVSASSYSDAAFQKGISIPAEKVEEMTLFPLNFFEFLGAQKPMLAGHLKESTPDGFALSKFRQTLEEKYLEFQLIGGMPEVVSNWLETKSIEAVESLQLQIIRGIENDFTKYAPMSLFPKLIAIWNSIPAQLVKHNSKFMFSHVKHSWRARHLEDALYWLIRAGLVYKVEHIEKPDLPLSGYANKTHFKLYMCDVGLLRRVGQIPAAVVLDKAERENRNIKSSFAENIVCCDLKQIYEQALFYWSAEKPGRAEVDFIFQDGNDIIPVKVKMGRAGRTRALSQYRSRFSPKKSVLTSMDSDKESVLPLYAFSNLEKWLQSKSDNAV